MKCDPWTYYAQFYSMYGQYLANAKVSFVVSIATVLYIVYFEALQKLTSSVECVTNTKDIIMFSNFYVCPNVIEVYIGWFEILQPPLKTCLNAES